MISGAKQCYCLPTQARVTGFLTPAISSLLISSPIYHIFSTCPIPVQQESGFQTMRNCTSSNLIGSCKSQNILRSKAVPYRQHSHEAIVSLACVCLLDCPQDLFYYRHSVFRSMAGKPHI